MAIKHLIVLLLLVLAALSLVLVYVEQPVSPKVEPLVVNLSNPILTDGNLTWTGYIKENEVVEINATAKPTQDIIEIKNNISTPGSEATHSKIYIGTYNSTHLIKYERNGTIIIYPRPKRSRTYEAWLGGNVSIYPEPRKGDASTTYFKSLNLTEEFYYVVMQFEGDGAPTDEQRQILAQDNISIFEPHGDFTYYAKISKSMLENKAYDFVRWIEMPEMINSSWKIADDRLRNTYSKECNGSIKLTIEFYERINETQESMINNIAKILYYDRYMDIEIDIVWLRQLVSFNFVKKLWVIYPITTGWGDSPDPFGGILCD